MTSPSDGQWAITTVRWTATIIFEGPTPAHVLLQRKDEDDPIRIDADDAELLMWVLARLKRGQNPRFSPFPADSGAS